MEQRLNPSKKEKDRLGKGKRGTGIKIYAQVSGQGDPVIFLPAMGWTAESAGPLVSVLEERYQFHRLDLPGFGRSEPFSKVPSWKDFALWIHRYCEQQQWNQVRIIGHSLGGIMALAYADQFPERVYQLVLLDAGYQPIPRFPEDIAKPFRYLVPALNFLASWGGIRVLTRWIGESGRVTEGSGPSSEELEKAFQEFVESQHLLITNELREAFYTAHQLVTFNPLAINLLLGIYRSKPVMAFNRLKPATLLVVPEHMTHYTPLTQIDEKGLPVLLYEVNSGHFVHYARPEVAHVIRDFFDHWN